MTYYKVTLTVSTIADVRIEATDAEQAEGMARLMALVMKNSAEKNNHHTEMSQVEVTYSCTEEERDGV